MVGHNLLFQFALGIKTEMNEKATARKPFTVANLLGLK